MNDKIKEYRLAVQNAVTILENASPQTILNRGYSMVTDENGNVIRDANVVNNGQTIKIKPAVGEFKAIIKK